MSWTKKLAVVFLQIIVTVLGLELGSRVVFPNPESDYISQRSDYTADELSQTLPFTRKENGSECVSITNNFSWNQWWGFSQKTLNSPCVKQLFNEKSFTVVFMGGSAMFNAEAPNYLTHIEYYATRDLRDLASINLAESGARHKNMSIRFQRQVLPIKPDLVIFLDGFNEFNSLRYGGDPLDDFYWTAGVKARVHQPYRVYIDKLIEVSKFSEALLLRTGLYSSARVVSQSKTLDSDVKRAAGQFLSDVQVTKALCKQYGIQCEFVLQPHVFNSDNVQHRQIIEHANLGFPGFQKSVIEGYRLMKETCDFCVDASELLKGQSNTFRDPVHFDKKGSELVGNLLRSLISQHAESKAFKKAASR